MIKTCQNCEEEFELYSKEKRQAGGLASHCPDCSEEKAVKYIGVQNGEGKGSQTQILAVNSKEDRAKYIAFWQNNSGLHSGKSCNLGSHLSTDPGINFKTIVAHENMNHKGKL
jgi:hypothetical protein